MTSKFQTVLLAFSGVIVYSAICIVCGFLFAENVYIKLVACSLTIIIGGLYIKTVLKYPPTWNNPPKQFIAVMLTTIVVFAFTSMFTARFLLSGYINDEAFMAVTETKAELPLGQQILTLIVSFAFVPLAEEIIFRGLMYRQLATFNKTFALLFTSVFFALWHGTLIHLYTGLLGGLILCCICEKTQKLRYSVAAHSLFNILTSFAGVFDYPECFNSVWFIAAINVLCVSLIVVLFRTEGTKPVQTVIK